MHSRFQIGFIRARVRPLALDRKDIAVALVPAAMFMRELDTEAFVRPFATGIDFGRYWLKPESDAMAQFGRLLAGEADATGEFADERA